MKRKFVLLILIVFVLFGAIYAIRYPILTGMGEYLVAYNPLQKADLIVALGGSKGRQREAVALIKKGFGRRIMFTGFDVDTCDYQCLGVSKEEMIFPSEPAYTTYDDALLVLKTMKENNFRSVIIITSPYHLRRVSFIFRKVFNESGTTLIFHSSYKEPFEIKSWWKSYIGRKMVIMEYLGLVYYQLRYGI